MACLSGLPLELVQQILPEIDSLKDLLSLALTSRAFCALIIPDHLEYRVISAGDAESSTTSPLWPHLVQISHLSRNIRALSIGRRTSDFNRLPSALVPLFLNDSSHAAEPGIFPLALRKMEKLEIFSWHVHGGVYNPAAYLYPDDQVFRALLNCVNLTRLELSGVFRQIEDTANHSVGTLRSLLIERY